MVICGIGSVNYFKRSRMNNYNQIWNLAKLKWKRPGPTPWVGQSNWNCESVSLTGFLTSIHHLIMADMSQDQLQHEHEAYRKSALADESPPLRKHEMPCGECRQQQLYSQSEFIWHQDLLCKSKFEHVFCTFLWRFLFLSSTELHCLLLPHWSISGQKTLANPSAALHKAEFEGEGFGRQKCDHQCLWKSRSLDKK